MACRGCQERQAMMRRAGVNLRRGNFSAAGRELSDMAQSLADDVRVKVSVRQPGDLSLRPPPEVPEGEKPKLRLRPDIGTWAGMNKK